MKNLYVAILVLIVGCGNAPQSVRSSRGVDSVTLSSVEVELQFDFARGTITAINHNALPMAVFLFDTTNGSAAATTILSDGLTLSGNSSRRSGVALRPGMTIHAIVGIYTGLGTALLGGAVTLLGVQQELASFAQKHLLQNSFEGDIVVE